MRYLLVFYLWIMSFNSYAISFKEAVALLEKHELVELLQLSSELATQNARRESSWGDPQFKVAAKNYPQDDLRNDRSPMTGVEYSLSQKIPLSSKYGIMGDAQLALAQAYQHEAEDKKLALEKNLWEILIYQKKLKDELSILQENKSWIAKMLKVSKRLYSNGKTSQQALFDIGIRESEIDTQISNRSYELLQLDDQLKYLLGNRRLDQKSIPWKLLGASILSPKDHRQIALSQQIKAKELSYKAATLNFIPDITLSLGKTQRANIDGQGDFVSAAISFPLPFSSVKYAQNSQAIFERKLVEKKYENYQNEKERDVAVFRRDIKKIVKELEILDKKMISFAKNSRSITATSYGLGEASYTELLQSELKLQQILMQRIQLEALHLRTQVGLRYLLGGALYE